VSIFGGRSFATAIIALSCLASAAYYAGGDWRRGTYWLAGAVLNVSVTF
jgi:hypothetical protein